MTFSFLGTAARIPLGWVGGWLAARAELPEVALGANVLWGFVIIAAVLAGFGAVLLRAVQRFMRASHATQERQHAAMEAVLVHAERMSERSKELDALATSFGKAFTETLEAHAVRVGKNTTQAVAPLVERALDSGLRTLRDGFGALDAQLSMTQTSQAQQLSALAASLTQASTDRRTADREAVDALGARANQLVHAFEARADRFGDGLEKMADRVAARMGDDAGTLMTTLVEKLDALREVEASQLGALTRTLEDAAGERRAADQALALRVEARLDQLSARELERTEKTSTLVTALQEEITRWTAAAEALRSASQGLDAQRAASDDRAATRLSQLADQLQALGAAQGTAFGALADSLNERVKRLESLHQTSAEAILARFEEAAGRFKEVMTDLSDRLIEVEGRVAARLDEEGTQQQARVRAMTEALSERIVEQARVVDERARASADSLAEAMSLVRAGGAELTALAELFASAIEQHRDAQEAALSNLQAIDNAVVALGEGAARETLGQYLTRTHELFDQQLAFQEALLARLGVPGAFYQAPMAEADDAGRASGPVSRVFDVLPDDPNASEEADLSNSDGSVSGVAALPDDEVDDDALRQAEDLEVAAVVASAATVSG